MKTLLIAKQVGSYDELDEKAKENARKWFARGEFDCDWYDSTYEDAKTIGLVIDAFDTYRHTIDGKLVKSVGEVCRLILANHGASCDTYKLAQDYFKRKHFGTPYSEEDFKHDLLEEYLVMLQHEVEYMESKEYIEDGIRANEYTFDSHGNIV